MLVKGAFCHETHVKRTPEKTPLDRLGLCGSGGSHCPVPVVLLAAGAVCRWERLPCLCGIGSQYHWGKRGGYPPLFRCCGAPGDLQHPKGRIQDRCGGVRHPRRRSFPWGRPVPLRYPGNADEPGSIPAGPGKHLQYHRHLEKAEGGLGEGEKRGQPGGTIPVYGTDPIGRAANQDRGV